METADPGKSSKRFCCRYRLGFPPPWFVSPRTNKTNINFRFVKTQTTALLFVPQLTRQVGQYTADDKTDHCTERSQQCRGEHIANISVSENRATGTGKGTRLHISQRLHCPPPAGFSQHPRPQVQSRLYLDRRRHI